MKCSDQRIASNRANSLKSTGPRDTSQTRYNARKHGLTAARALPDEDQDALQESLDNLVRDHDPRSEEELFLVEDTAHLIARLRRCRRHNDAMTAFRQRHAVDEFTRAREDVLNAAIDRLERDPEASLATLKSDPDGLDWLASRWESLRDDLAATECGKFGTLGSSQGPFEQSRILELIRLRGLRWDLDHRPRELNLHEAFHGFAENLGPADRDAVPDEAKPEWARGQLREVIERELAEVRELLDEFDLTVLRADQEEAEDRAKFDPSPEATLARKYEAATRRELKRAFKELKEIKARRAESAPAAPEPPASQEVASKGRGSMASFFPGDGGAPVEEGIRPISPPRGSDGAELMAFEGRPGVEMAVPPPQIE